VRVYDGALERPLSLAEHAALPHALARQPLWSFGVWVAHLDDERGARAHAAGLGDEVALGLAITDEIERWQEAFS
jgi:hypothetical protein